MPSDRFRALEALFRKTEAAHGEYESTQLNGVYDQDWARWYADYALDNGFGALTGAPVSPDELAGFFSSSWEEAQRADPPPTDPWPTQAARHVDEMMPQP
jgi:hypothetical protein